MNRTRSIRQPKSQIIRRERDSISWRYCFFAFVCILSLSVGFFGAARQHFASIQFSIENSKLKKEIEKMESDRRNLKLMKEIALSPAEVKKTARKIGLTEMTAGNIVVYNPPTTKPTPEKAAFDKVLVTKTVDVKPVLQNDRTVSDKTSTAKTAGDAKSAAKNPDKKKVNSAK